MALNADGVVQDFLDAVSLWRIEAGTTAAEVIDSATNCLIAGVDVPAMCALAGLSPRDSRFEIDPVVDEAIAQLGACLDPSPQLAAMRTMARRLMTGHLAPAELAAWAHAHVGHDGDPRCQPFVTLDDMYGVWDYDGAERTELDEFVREESKALIAGRPSPGRYESRWFGGAPLEG